MSIFKTEVAADLVTQVDSVVVANSGVLHPVDVPLPGFKITHKMDVQNTHPGAIRRKGNPNG